MKDSQLALAHRAIRLADSNVSDLTLIRAFDTAWNAGKTRKIGVLYNALTLRNRDPLAWFREKWNKLTA